MVRMLNEHLAWFMQKYISSMPKLGKGKKGFCGRVEGGTCQFNKCVHIPTQLWKFWASSIGYGVRTPLMWKVLFQCSPYQAVTVKIFCLKQHFVRPATAWRFTKIKKVALKNTQVVIWSNQGNEWMYGKVLLKVYTAFLFFMGHTFWKENIEDRVKLLKSNILNCCLKRTMANLHKIGLKMREWHFREHSS